MDPGSSSYVATFDGKGTLAGLVGAEYLRRGGTTPARSSPSATARRRSGRWPRLSTRTPPTSYIYHAREHWHDLAAHLAFITRPPRWLAARLDDLDAGNIEAIIGAAPGTPGRHQGRGPGQETALLRARHPPDALHPVQNLGIFTGSGAIEAACSKSSPPASSRACTGPSRAPQTSSRYAASTPAAAGRALTTDPHHRHAPPSDRQHNQTSSQAATKNIPNNPVVHPVRRGCETRM